MTQFDPQKIMAQLAAQQQAQQAAPVTPAPQPVPTAVSIDLASMSDGARAVVMAVHDITGSHITFLHAANAKQVGEMLLAKAREAESGIVIAPTNGHVQP